MGRPKGGKNKHWTIEKKLTIINRYFEDGIGQYTLAKEESISRGMLINWIYKYIDEGTEGLVNKKKTGNHLLRCVRVNL